MSADAMGWTLNLGDCLDPVAGLATLPDRSVDVVITDPPYGIGDAPLMDLPGRGGRGNNKWAPPSDWDAKIDPAWCAEVCRVSPLVIWFGQWRKRSEVAAAMPHQLRAEIVWAKDTHVGPPCPVAMQDERIWVFSAAGVQTHEFATSVWAIPIIPTWAHKRHKNEKPEALMEKAIKVFSAPGQLILDPFAGSGTTGVAAIRLGRRFIGWERDPKYHAAAVRRLDGTREQTDMFRPKAPKPKQERLL